MKMSTIKVVSMNQDRILGQQPEIIYVSVPTTEIYGKPTANNKKAPTTPKKRVTSNRLHRATNKSEKYIEPETIEPEVKKPLTIEETMELNTKRKPNHYHMRPATSTERHAANQMLAQMRNSIIHPQGYLHARGVKLSTYNLARYLNSIDTYFIDVDDLSATDTQQRFTPSWQIEIYKAIQKLNEAKVALKAGIGYPEDVYELQQKLDQLIARHSSDQKSDYKSQMRTARRQAKNIIQETSTKQPSPADLYELDAGADDNTANVYEHEEVEINTVEDAHDVSMETIQLAWAQVQDDAQKQRFADCVNALYGPQKHK